MIPRTLPRDELDLAILQVVNTMGVATRAQIQTYLSHPRRIATLRRVQDCPPWATHVTRYRVDQVVRRHLLDILPFRGTYYAGQAAVRQTVVRLTRAGAEALQAAGISASARALPERQTLSHTLAVLDVHSALLALPDVAALETDPPPGGDERGQAGLRHDGCVRWTDPARPWALFESELWAEPVSEARLRNKLTRLARFFLSDLGRAYDPAVRVIYLWKPLADSGREDENPRRLRQHEMAMNAWAEACYAVRVQMPDQILPFQLYFISHHDFLAHPDAPLSDYELLPANGAFELPGLRASQTVPGAAVDCPPVDSLDAPALSWMVEFYRSTRNGIRTMTQLRTLCGVLSAFLDQRPALRIALHRTILPVIRAESEEEVRWGLEQVGVTLLCGLGIPAGEPDCTDHLENEYPITPVGLAAPGENAGLTFIINPVLADHLVATCPDVLLDELAKALALFVRFFVQKQRELDLVASRRVAGKGL
jgi:hypothetical protein